MNSITSHTPAFISPNTKINRRSQTYKAVNAIANSNDSYFNGNSDSTYINSKIP
jgi:hypothetical protein